VQTKERKDWKDVISKKFDVPRNQFPGMGQFDVTVDPSIEE
jgi:hypothetical protein